MTLNAKDHLYPRCELDCAKGLILSCEKNLFSTEGQNKILVPNIIERQATPKKVLTRQSAVCRFSRQKCKSFFHSSRRVPSLYFGKTFLSFESDLQRKFSYDAAKKFALFGVSFP